MNSILSLVVAALASSGESASLPPPPGQDAPPTYPQWSGALAVGAVFTEGNSVTDSANANINAQRRDEKDRLTLDAFWNWAQQKGDTSASAAPDEDDTELTQRNYGAGAKYDYFTSKKLYWYGNASGKVDDIAELDYRAILGAGVGYQWRETEKLKWGTELGVSGVKEDRVDNDFNEENLAARVASNLAWQISESSSFEQVAEAYPADDSADLIAKFDNRLKMNITGKWIAQLQYVLDFDNSVPPGTEETDHRVVLGLGWSFGG